MLADPYDAILLDLDGVLYRWPEPIHGAADAVASLRDAGKRIAFVTNNSSRTPAQVAERLASVGVSAEPEEVVTSALATADAQRARLRSAFVVGEEGLLEALGRAGIRAADASADGVDVVVVGFDRGADYTKLKDASVLVERGVPLVASNADPSFPAPGVSPGPAPERSSPRSKPRPARAGGRREARAPPLRARARLGRRWPPARGRGSAGHRHRGRRSARVGFRPRAHGSYPSRGRGGFSRGSRRSSSTTSRLL